MKQKNAKRPKHHRYIWQCFLLWCLMLSGTQGALPYKSAYDPIIEATEWRSWDLRTGTRSITHDAAGNTWIGTEAGILKYNGLQWEAFIPNATPPVNLQWIEDANIHTNQELMPPINVLCATSKGLYAGSEMGIFHFQQGKWLRVFPLKPDLAWPVYDILETTQGNIWCGTAWGALQTTQATEFVLYTSTDMAQALKQMSLIPTMLQVQTVPDLIVPQKTWVTTSKPGTLGLRVAAGGYIGLNRGTVPQTIWAVAPNSPADQANIQPGDKLLNEPDANERIGPGPLRTQVTLRIAQKVDTLVTLSRKPISNTFREFQVYDIYQDQNDVLWFGLESGEIIRTNLANDAQWQMYSQKDGLSQRPAPRLSQTQNGHIWAVTNHSQGLINKFNGTTWDSVRAFAKDHTHNAILTTQDGMLWLGDRGFLRTYKQGKWQSYRSRQEPIGHFIPENRILALSEDSRGAIWVIGSGQRISRLNYKHPQWQTHPGLNFQLQTPDGRQWFVEQTGSIVQFDGQNWKQYDQKDGLMDSPVAIIQDTHGKIWAAGSHKLTAATAQFNPQQDKWVLNLHPFLSEVIGWRTLFVSSDGSIWFGDNATWRADQGHRSGILRWHANKWTHYDRQQSSDGLYGIAETKDQILWSGGYAGLYFLDLSQPFEAQSWQRAINSKTPPITPLPTNIRKARCEAFCVTQTGDFWIGTRDQGAFCYTNGTWFRYDTSGRYQFDAQQNIWTIQSEDAVFALPENFVKSIQETPDGKIWIATYDAVTLFDKQYDLWLPQALTKGVGGRGSIRMSSDGTLWINKAYRGWQRGEMPIQTSRFLASQDAPETQISEKFNLISFPQSSNTTFVWHGQDMWDITRPENLYFSWRLDNGPWSRFTKATSQTFQDTLAIGPHTFEIKAMDTDFNVDLTPAQIEFSIAPPIWATTWFLFLVTISLGAIVYLSTRVIKHERDLSNTNQALSKANAQFLTANQNLLQEIAERERLDTQIKNLHFLYSLRASLGEKNTPQEVIQTLGAAIVDLLGNEGSLTITLDDQSFKFGQQMPPSQEYKRELIWGERSRGDLILYSPFTLSESQERTLLDETSGQLTRVLESRELQMQLLQSARLVSLGQMAAGVAHELNQPLGGISATAEDYYLRLQDNMSVSSEQLAETFKRILGMVDRMSNTVEHLRVFSRDTSQEPGKPLNLNEVIQSSLDIIGTQLKNHSIDVKLELAPELPQMTGHPYQVEQIFLNLLGNARDALDTQPASHTSFKTITISTHHKPNTIIATIQDNGAGIDQEHLNRIFEPFYTTKPADKGTGLGLSITYAIVKNHGGNITCTSTKDKGTTFEVTFPILQPNT